MKRTPSRRTIASAIVVCILLVSYVSSYFATTEIYHGQFDSKSMGFRLFSSSSHKTAFLPLVSLEERLRSGSNFEFYSHVRNGASLPPAHFNTQLSKSIR
jgi:hypothetical protein